MKITIVGKGKMGTPLAKLSSAAGHVVTTVGSNDVVETAIAGADLVILATSYAAAHELASNPSVRAAMKEKIVVDITNPLSPDYMSLTLGHTTSAAEEIAKAIPESRIVKAFNTIFSGLLDRRVDGKPVVVPVFVAGDDASAKETVIALAHSFGFDVFDGGMLTNARYLEPMAEFMIQLGYGLGHGGEVGFALVKAA